MDLFKILLEKGLLVEGADETIFKASADQFAEEIHQEKTVNLIKNRDELKEEKKTAVKDLQEYKSKFAFAENISAESLTDMKNELESFRSGNTDEERKENLQKNYERGKQAKEDELLPKLTKLESDLKISQDKAEVATVNFQEYKAEAEIRKAVDKTGIKAPTLWFDGLKSAAKVEINEAGKMSISLPYESGHLPIEDWVKSYPGTEECKRMLPAKVDMGGGGFGGAGDNEEKLSTGDQYNKMFKF